MTYVRILAEAAVANGTAARKAAYFATKTPAISATQYELVYDTTSFGTAAMMAATLFFWLRLRNISPKYQSAVAITGLVTFIAGYHYFRIFNSWTEAFKHMSVADCETYMKNNEWNACPMIVTGVPFNDAYRYMDWLLTVPLLLIEIVLVMNLTPEETVKKSALLGVSSALMVILGYPGELIPAGSPDIASRWGWWAAGMLPFLFVVYQLTIGTKAALDTEEDPDVKSKIQTARIVTIVSWLTYPIVYILPCLGLSGAQAIVGVQMGYTLSDIISKCGVGILIYKIALAKSQAETNYNKHNNAE